MMMMHLIGHHLMIDDEWMKVDEDILIRLKRNDPTLNQLEVSLDERDQFIDWEKEGRAISENTHIKYLFVANPEDDDSEKYIPNLKAFYRGLAGNRSVGLSLSITTISDV